MSVFDTISFLGRIFLLGLLFFPENSRGQHGEYPHCQILDRQDEPIWSTYLSYVSKADLASTDGDDFGLMEMGVQSGISYLYTEAGTLDISASFDTRISIGDGNIDIPDLAGTLKLEVDWVTRSVNGWAIKLGISPGFYSDFEDLTGEDLFLPVSVVGIQSFNPHLSGLVGLNVYPNFDRVLDPQLGLRWDAHELLLVDIFYPESKLIYYFTEGWEFTVGLQILEVLEYQLKDEDPRERYRLDEKRWYMGVEHAINSQISFISQVGQVFDRELDFENGTDGTGVDSSYFVRIGLNGYL